MSINSALNHKSVRKVGFGIGTVLLALLTLELVIASVKAQTLVEAAGLVRPDGKTSTGRPVLEFKLYRGYLMVISGSVGGLTNLHFIVDTSTSPSIADRRLVERLGLSQRSGSVTVPGQTVGAGRAVLTDVQVGPISAKSLPVFTLDLSSLEQALGTRIDMLMGLDVLGQSSFSIDYQAKRIVFGAPSALPQNFSMESGAPLVSVTALLDGQPCRLLVNTAFPDLMLEGPAGEAIQTVKMDPPRLAVNATGGQVVLKRSTVRSMRLGEVELRRQPIFLMNGPRKEFDGSLPITARFKEVAFDFEHHLVGIRR